MTIWLMIAIIFGYIVIAFLSMIVGYMLGCHAASDIDELVTCDECTYRTVDGFCYKDVEGVGYKKTHKGGYCDRGHT